MLIVRTDVNCQNRCMYVYPEYSCVNNSVNTSPIHRTHITVIKLNAIVFLAKLFENKCQYNRLFIGMSSLHGETSQLIHRGHKSNDCRVFINLSNWIFVSFSNKITLCYIHLVLDKKILKLIIISNINESGLK